MTEGSKMSDSKKNSVVTHYDVNAWNYREGDEPKPLPCGTPEGEGVALHMTDNISAVTCEGCKKALFQS
jgi:hypothetical protein